MIDSELIGLCLSGILAIIISIIIIIINQSSNCRADNGQEVEL